jgi:nucleoside-diphosphate-sugar epimerase
MKVSIIGSNGLIASHIGIYCNQNNFNVFSFGRTESRLYSSNFKKFNLITDTLDYDLIIDSDIVFYAAGSGVQSYMEVENKEIFHVNAFEPIKIIKELENRDFLGIFISFGSYFEIGNNVINVKFKEKEVINSPNSLYNDYSLSKRLLTKFIDSLNGKVSVLHLILPTIYSQYESEFRLIPYILNAIKRNEVLNFTHGTQVRQYLYAGDLPKVIFKLIEAKYLGVINVSGNETYNIKEIVKLILNLYNREFLDDMFGSEIRRDEGMMNLQLDDSMLKNIIGDFTYSKIVENLTKYN